MLMYSNALSHAVLHVSHVPAPCSGKGTGRGRIQPWNVCALSVLSDFVARQARARAVPDRSGVQGGMKTAGLGNDGGEEEETSLIV